jgi:hypothetical protein
MHDFSSYTTWIRGVAILLLPLLINEGDGPVDSDALLGIGSAFRVNPLPPLRYYLVGRYTGRYDLPTNLANEHRHSEVQSAGAEAAKGLSITTSVTCFDGDVEVPNTGHSVSVISELVSNPPIHGRILDSKLLQDGLNNCFVVVPHRLRFIAKNDTGQSTKLSDHLFTKHSGYFVTGLLFTFVVIGRNSWHD